MALKQLPKKWALPDKIEGDVTGKAALVVTIRNGVPTTSGEGKGSIDNVKLVGLPANSIPLDLEADDKGIHIKPRSPILHMLLQVMAPLSTSTPRSVVPAAPARPISLQPARLVGQALTVVSKSTNWLVAALRRC